MGFHAQPGFLTHAMGMAHRWWPWAQSWFHDNALIVFVSRCPLPVGSAERLTPQR